MSLPNAPPLAPPDLSYRHHLSAFTADASHLERHPP